MSVEIGSVWEEMDSRMGGRRVRVVRIEGPRAVVVNIHDHQERPRETRIRIQPSGRLNRFKRVSAGGGTEDTKP